MEVQVTRAAAIMRNLEPLTVGMSKAVPVKLTMSADWDGLAKTAIFKAGTTQIDVTDAAWVDATTVFVPPEVLTKAGSRVQFGLYGTDSDDAIVIPTIWVNLGKVQPAPDPSGDPTTDPTLPVWAQLQGEMIDGAEIDAEGHLILTLHNGETIDAGSAVGPQGPAGADGKGASMVEFTATLSEWDTLGSATSETSFEDIVTMLQDGPVMARLTLTVSGTDYVVDLQSFSANRTASFYGIGLLPSEDLRVVAVMGAEGYWFVATEKARKVESVNGKTGAVVLDAADVGAATESYVDSAISQSTAFYRGNFATRAALLAVAWQTTNPAGANYVTNNDYAVVLDDETQNDECWRYIYVTGSGWTAQYRINETPLTQAQLDAVNSGATAAKINQIATNTTAISGKITAPASPASGAFLVWNGSAWTAQTLAVWQGGSY